VPIGFAARIAAVLSVALYAAAPARAADPFYPDSASLLRHFAAAGIPAEPLAHALQAFRCGCARGEFTTPTLTLVDYSLPSTRRRLWVLDLATGAVRFHTLVAHGRGSGLLHARSFSNVPGSKQSSLGLFRTGDTYLGQHGYSLRLAGLEPGVNDLAYQRAIVVHGAEYATPGFASSHGRLGRSWGCPALDPSVTRELIHAIVGGTALFAYYPDPGWLGDSRFLRCEGGLESSRVSRVRLQPGQATLSRGRDRLAPLAPLARLAGR
jgi:hypothetical protein